MCCVACFSSLLVPCKLGRAYLLSNEKVRSEYKWIFLLLVSLLHTLLLLLPLPPKRSIFLSSALLADQILTSGSFRL